MHVKTRSPGPAFRRNSFLVGLTVLSGVLSVVSHASAADLSSAKGSAMGGAVTGLADGTDAARMNPANLGLDRFHRNQLEILGAGVFISNNSFTLADYNTYNGAFWTDRDKADILNRIPTEGLELSGEGQGSVVSLATNRVAITSAMIWAADASVSRDIIELILNGNTFADTIDVSGSRSEMIGYAKASLSYGYPIYTAGTRQVSLGATFGLIRGIMVEQMVEARGLAVTEESGLAGEGRFAVRTGSDGLGYTLDVGCAVQFNDMYTGGVSIKNALGSIRWSRDTREHGYIFSFDTMTVDNMQEDHIISEDYTRDIGPFSTGLPAVMNVGLARISEPVIWVVNWEQGLERAVNGTTNPRFSIGVQWSCFKCLPLRGGFATGGRQSTNFTLGSGISLGAFYLDAATVTATSYSPNSSKGISLAISTGLRF